MKTFKTFFAALIATCTASLAFASGTGNLKVTMEPAENEITAVEISSTSLNNFEIDLKNSYGEKLYSMKTVAPTNGIKKKYDFSKLGDGIYWYSVKMDKVTTTKKMQMDNGDLEILEVRKSVEPTFLYKDKLLKLGYLNPQREDSKLYVYDSSNKLLISAELGSDFAIHKTVDFSEKDNETYNVVIANDTEIHEYKVSVE